MLEGAAVSPLHAGFFLDDEGCVTISDTKSVTGVFVNGVKVFEHAVEDGDEISIGPPGDPGSARLLFVAKGSDSPVAETGETAPEQGDPFLDAIEAQAAQVPPPPFEDADPLSGLGEIAFESPAAVPAEPDLSFLPEPEPLPVPDPQPAVDLLPEPEPLSVPEPQAAADFLPEPEPLSVPGTAGRGRLPPRTRAAVGSRTASGGRLPA